MAAQSAGAVEYTVCVSAEGLHSPNECPGYDTKTISWWVSSNAGALKNGSITSLPSLQVYSGPDGSTWLGPIDGSNGTKLCTYAKRNCLK